MSESFPAACFHCNAPLPHGARWNATIGGQARAFCCGGCMGIAQTIAAAGLGGYFVRREGHGERPRAKPDAQGDARWDEVADSAGIARDTAEGREVSLLLEGMHCGACVALIEAFVARAPGVVAASVNYATRRARVVYDPRATKLSAVIHAIARIGYRAHPYDPARREAVQAREGRTLLARLAVAFLSMMQVMMFAVPAYVSVEGVEPGHRQLLAWASLTLTLPALLYSAAPFFRGALRDLRTRHPGMDVPVAIGLAAAFAASVRATFAGEGALYYDSITMFIALYTLARFVEFAARRRAGDAIEAIARVRPATALLLRDWPQRTLPETVAAAALVQGDLVLVRPGAAIPADGEIVDGAASVDEALLTGESRPRLRKGGDRVLAGSHARDGALVIRVTAAGLATRAASIERLAIAAAGDRPRIARLADRVATWFVAALLAFAAAAAIAWLAIDPGRVLAITFAVLVVSCPCALSLATPATIAAALIALARRQVLLARVDALETLARVTHVVFDKTGTLTLGRLSLREVIPAPGVGRDEVLAIAAALEARSEHPIAIALRAAAPGAISAAAALRIVPGQGVEGEIDGRLLRMGRADFVGALSGALLDIAAAAVAPAHTRIVLGDRGGILASFVLADALRPGAAATIAALAARGIVPVMLSGDRADTVAVIAAQLRIDDAAGDALPEDKERAIAALQEAGAVVAMIGDGVNDAPALARAQVSLGIHGGTTLAQWTADGVILGDDLGRVVTAIDAARRAMRIVRQNLAWAVLYNSIAIPAAAMGFVTPLAAAIGMSASSLAVVANALRAARLRDPPEGAAIAPAAVAAVELGVAAGVPRSPAL